MDLVAGAKRVIVAMEHSDRTGSSKIVPQCTFPITGKLCVSLIVTDIAVIEVTAAGLLLNETAPGWSGEQVQAETEAVLKFSETLHEIEL